MIAFFDELVADELSYASYGNKTVNLARLFQQSRELGFFVPDGCGISVDFSHCFLEKMRNSQNIEQLQRSCLVGIKDKNFSCVDKFFMKELIPTIWELELKKVWERLSCYGRIPLAVRSSGSYEDTAGISAAGLHQSFLNVQTYEEFIGACCACVSSLFSAEAIAYRNINNIHNFAMGICVQQMASKVHCAGVAFTCEPESNNFYALALSVVRGFGEELVQGRVTPDEYVISKVQKPFFPIIFKKFCQKEEILIDEEIFKLSEILINIEEKWKNVSENTFGFDIEWAYSRELKQVYVLQIRPQTSHLVHEKIIEYQWNQKPPTPYLKGMKVGNAIVSGSCFVAHTLEYAVENMPVGSILVVEMTTPDWLPVLKRAHGLITERGGRTCHAAIVARELGIPGIVGCEHAFDLLKTNDVITLDAFSNAQIGYVYYGKFEWDEREIAISTGSSFNKRYKLMAIIADPEQALNVARLPFEGVGLVRLEFVMAQLKVHPAAILYYQKLNCHDQQLVLQAMGCQENRLVESYIDRFAKSIAMLALPFGDKQVIVRTSDFKTNEYRGMVGGFLFEGAEENPMLGLRGAARYLHSSYKDVFLNIECQALLRARDLYGAQNIDIMIPFVRTVSEIACIKRILADIGLLDGRTKLYMMIEIPSNVILMEQFAEFVDGFSIGSNDLTQLVLGVDRDNHHLAFYNENDGAVRAFLSLAIEKANKLDKPIGICGQAPADFPQIANLIIDQGIDTISIQPSSYFSFIREQKNF